MFLMAATVVGALCGSFDRQEADNLSEPHKQVERTVRSVFGCLGVA